MVRATGTTGRKAFARSIPIQRCRRFIMSNLTLADLSRCDDLDHAAAQSVRGGHSCFPHEYPPSCYGEKPPVRGPSYYKPALLQPLPARALRLRAGLHPGLPSGAGQDRAAVSTRPSAAAYDGAITHGLRPGLVRSGRIARFVLLFEVPFACGKSGSGCAHANEKSHRSFNQWPLKHVAEAKRRRR
ncbi:hypothetical protein OKW40_007604 [Paraburkholderia sp. RAU6.4a]